MRWRRREFRRSKAFGFTRQRSASLSLWLFANAIQDMPGRPAVIASQCRPGAYLGRYVVVVDDDIDIYNPDDVIWALATRSDPANSIEIVRRAWSGPLDPIIPPEAKGFNSRALIDATRPYEWRDRFPAVNAVSPTLKERLSQKYAPLLSRMLSRNV